MMTFLIILGIWIFGGFVFSIAYKCGFVEWRRRHIPWFSPGDDNDPSSYIVMWPLFLLLFFTAAPFVYGFKILSWLSTRCAMLIKPKLKQDYYRRKVS